MVLALSEAGQRAAALGLAAAAALAVWLLVLLVLALATRPDLPEPVAATSELGGSESPAVVSFLVNRWEVGREAVPATLLDLAARGTLDIDQVAPERFVCRLGPAGAADRGGAGPLAGYEQQVLDHVRGLASPDGVVPCEALTTGPEAESAGWWKRFERAVVADARAQGLSRGRWGRAAIVVLGVVALAPALLATGALVGAPTDSSSSSSSSSSASSSSSPASSPPPSPSSTSSSSASSSSASSSSDDNGVGGVLALGAVAWFGLMAVPFSLRAERHTAAGRAAAARWLGLRAFLHDDEAFDRAPPSSVAIWDRYLSYGAAMGVAAGAVRPLPLGSESDREAWSSYGGRWHVVRVRYPVRVPPGWGQRPIVAAAKGLFALGIGLFLATRIGPALAGALGDFLDSSRSQDWEVFARVGVGILGVVLVLLGLFLVRSAVMLVFAVPDLFSKVQVEGLVVRLRNGYLAVDDGTRTRVRAWRVEPLKLAGVARGSVVRVTASKRLGHVFSIERVGEPQRAGLAAAPVGTAAGDAAELDLDLDAVAARTGVRLRLGNEGQPAAFPGADRAFVLTDDSGEGQVLVVVSHDHTDGTAGRTGIDVAGVVLRRLARRGGQPVPGLDGDASWSSRRNVLSVRRGGREVTVIVGLRHLPPERRRDLATALADALP